MRDIAEQCGVTKGTVSLALRGHPSIGAATTARVVAAARELGYNPDVHSAARRLALLRSNVPVINRLIALFHVPNFYSSSGGFASELFHGVLEGARAEGVGLLVDYLPDSNIDSPLLPVFDRSDVDAAILFGRSWATPLLARRLRNTAGFGQRPVISLLAELPGYAAVLSDDRQAAYQMVQHLLALGHREMVQCTFPQLTPQDVIEPAERIAGARQAFTEAGVDPDTHLHLLPLDFNWIDPQDLPAGHRVEMMTPPDDENSRRLLALLEAHPGCTAVLARNDADAFRVWAVLQSAGRDVPDMISVVGFDDTDPVLDASGENLLTTVRVPLVEIGITAAQLAITLAKDPVTPPVTRLLPATLMVRQSTGPSGHAHCRMHNSQCTM